MVIGGEIAQNKQNKHEEACSDTHSHGLSQLFMRLNTQTRNVDV